MWVAPAEQPYLGDEYPAVVDRLRREVEVLFASIRAWLDDFDEGWFLENFDAAGEATDDTAKRKQAAWKLEAERFQKFIFQWYQAGLGRPNLMADFDYWSMMAKFNVVEITLLSLGLEPTDYFRERLDPEKMRRRKTCPADDFATRRLEVFRRKFAQGNLRGTVLPMELVKWVRAVRLDSHPAFLRMIDSIDARENGSILQGTYTQDTVDLGLDRAPEGREVASLSKLLTAIAMDAYGYRPEDRRSPIPREIQDIADRLGLSVSQDTIRKYLQIGAKYLPADD